MTNARILRIFTDEAGQFGSLVGVVIDEDARLKRDDRQAIAQQLGYEETAFVNDIASANISIFSLQGEIEFAGVPVVGAAWLLTRISGKPIATIQALGGEVPTWQQEGVTWVRASLATMPAWDYVQYEEAEAVEHIAAEEGASLEHTMAWAWIDEAKGLIRARTFMSDWGIPEAEANGSGAMMLAAMIGRSIDIRHGEGSVIFAKPVENNNAEVGGRVVQDEDKSLS